MERWAFIINPVAGNGYAGQFAETVKEMIKLHHLEAEITFTQRKGHATEIARVYADKGYRYIIAVGGDGTFNEAAQALVDRENITFGTVSAGTGNDFIHILGFSEHFTSRDWDIFFELHTVKLDVGLCNDRYFINGIGFGFDAQVASENFNDMQANSGKKSSYWRQVFKNLLFYKEKKMRISANGKISDARYFITTIGNGRRFGGGFALTPLAVANDGLFDICSVKKLSLLVRIKELLAVLKGSHIYDKVVEYFQVDKILIETDEDVVVHMDGELFYGKRFDVRIFPSKINLIYNPYGTNYLSAASG